MTTYYVNADGDDNNDGLTPETAWYSVDGVLKGPASCEDTIRIKPRKPTDPGYFSDAVASLRLTQGERVIKNPWGNGDDPDIPHDHPDRPLGQVNGKRMPNGEWIWTELI